MQEPKHCLLIDTASHNCSVALATEGEVNTIVETNEPHIHSRKLGVYIQATLKKAGIQTHHLDAVAVGKGPGSYTGLRIGVATAKSICYSLEIPLIGINSLYSMAAQTKVEAADLEAMHCPMLDARRMEVFTAVYDAYLSPHQATLALVIDESSFRETLNNHVVYFSGNGMPKAKPYLEKYPNARFIENIWPSAPFMINEAMQKLRTDEIETVSQFEPFYLKPFKTNTNQKIDKVMNT